MENIYGQDLGLIHSFEIQGIGLVAQNSENVFVCTRRDESGLMKYSSWRFATTEEEVAYWKEFHSVFSYEYTNFTED